MPNTILSAAAQIRAELRRHTEKAAQHSARATQLQSALDALVGGTSPTSNWPNGHVKADRRGGAAWWANKSPEERQLIVAKRRATMAANRHNSQD